MQVYDISCTVHTSGVTWEELKAFDLYDLRDALWDLSLEPTGTKQELYQRIRAYYGFRDLNRVTQVFCSVPAIWFPTHSRLTVPVSATAGAIPLSLIMRTPLNSIVLRN